MPEAGIDYPKDWDQFLEWFSDEEKCYNYLEKIRWSTGFICPSCKIKQEPYVASRGRRICKSCLHQTSLTSSTIFHGTRTPLRVWFSVIWYVVNQKQGTNALGLQKILGFKSYQTAWAILHKLRRAMVRPDRDLLSGNVEVDEFYIGGPEENKKGRLVEKNSIVIVAVELMEKKGLGRIRLRKIDDVSENSLIPFICDNVEKGSKITTDGWSGYTNLKSYGYIHNAINISSSGDPAHVSMPGVHRVAALIKRWLLGTHHGSYSQYQLDFYLDEYTFRFNRRTSKSRGLLFYRLIEQAVNHSPEPYHTLIEPHN